jgi:hypothetical protein
MKPPFDDDEDLLRPRLTPAPTVTALIKELAGGAALVLAVAGCHSEGTASDGGTDAAIIAPMAPPMIQPPMERPPMIAPPMVAPPPDAAVIAPMAPPWKVDALSPAPDGPVDAGVEGGADARKDAAVDKVIIAPMPPPMPPPMPVPPMPAPRQP